MLLILWSIANGLDESRALELISSAIEAGHIRLLRDPKLKESKLKESKLDASTVLQDPDVKRIMAGLVKMMRDHDVPIEDGEKQWK